MPVGEEEMDKFGLNDMMGHTWEWCSDWSAVNSKRVPRGGAFPNAQGFLGSAPRGASAPLDKVSAFGFRVVWALSA